MSLPKITHPELDKIQNIKYGFMTRKGGVSTGIYSSLNFCFSKKYDDKNLHEINHISENKRIIAKDFGLDSVENFIYPNQVHSNKVFVLKDEKDLKLFNFENPTDKPELDAIVTKLKGVLIGAKGADCGMVLFVDEKNEVIGSAHSGWKGARDGILQNTVKEMINLGAELKNIKAVLGPCIKQESYEMTKEFMEENFLSQNPDDARFFISSKNENRVLFDLTGYIKEKLEETGLLKSQIFDVDRNTYTDEENLFSYRRACHQGYNGKYGAQISVIMLK